MELTSETVKAWLARYRDVGRDRYWLAERCETEKSTVDNWLSSARGLPSKAKLIIEKLMEADAREEAANHQPVEAQLSHITLRITTEELNDWARAYKESAAESFEDWTIAAIRTAIRAEREALAGAMEAHETGATAGGRITPFRAAVAGTYDESRSIVAEEAFTSPEIAASRAADGSRGAAMHEHWLDLVGGIAAGSPIGTDVRPEPVPAAKAYPDGCYALQVCGRSMEPKIRDGSRIVVKDFHSQGYPRKGTIVVYSDGSGSTLKQFGYRKARAGEEADSVGNVPVLRSLNPEYPDVQTMEGGRIDAVFVEALG